MASKHRDAHISVYVRDNSEEGMKAAMGLLQKKVSMSGMRKELKMKRFAMTRTQKRNAKDKDNEQKRIRTERMKAKRRSVARRRSNSPY